MWRSWSTNNSTVRVSSSSRSSSPSFSPSPLFSCSSFKDVESLCLEDSPQLQINTPQPQLCSSPTNKKASSVFHRVTLANSLVRAWSNHTQPHRPQPPPPPPSPPPPKPHRALSLPSPRRKEKHHHETEPNLQPPNHKTAKQNTENAPLYIPGTEQRVVVYFTSLRVVRHTFKSCRTVLSILTGFRVPIDERDVSMDSSFLTELGRILGPDGPNKLPCVFIGGRYVGGEEEVICMNETGELKKLLEALPMADTGECHACGGQRFVLCDECDGSRKVYTEKNGEFTTCGNCNENGLLRCPICFAESPIFST